MKKFNIKPQNIEGTPHEVAAQFFKKFIGPMFDELAKSDSEMALEFGFCVAGNAMACYLNSCSDVDKAKDQLIKTIEAMTTDIKKSRKKYN